MEYRIKEGVLIEDVGDVVKRIEQMSGCYDVSIEKIANFINENRLFFYVDTNSKVQEYENINSLYLWMNTGYLDETYNKPIFISLVKKNGEYQGRFVGVSKYLSGKITSFYSSNVNTSRMNQNDFEMRHDSLIKERGIQYFNGSTNESNFENLVKSAREKLERELSCYRPEESVKKEVKSEEHNNEEVKETSTVLQVTKDIWDRLLVKNWKEIEGLNYYLKICGSRLSELIKQEKEECYVLNNIKSAIINTGLLNQFGQDIYVMYRYHVKTGDYCPHKLIESKNDFIVENFTKEQAQKTIKAITFVDEEFSAESLDDFDITYYNLTHILRERKERLPNLSEQWLADKLQRELDLGLAIARRDKSFVKPFYSAKQKKVSWLLPFHVKRDFKEEPELVMVISKKEAFYEVKTVLPYDEVMKNKIDSLSLYRKIW